MYINKSSMLIYLLLTLTLISKSITNANEISIPLVSQENKILIKRQFSNSTADDVRNFNLNEFFKEVLNEVSSLRRVNPIILISIGAFIVFLLAFYLYARFKYPEGRSTIIFSVTLILLDMGLDIAFLKNNVRDVPNLFLPSLIALLGPAGFNLLFAFTIIVQQALSHDDFGDWIHDHATIATIFTFLSMFHIETLRLLISKFLDSEIFKAPFSYSAKKWLFGAGLFNIFIEDLPQFVILIFYFKAIGKDFTLIPILTLFFSFLSLLFGLINRVYELVSLNRRRK